MTSINVIITGSREWTDRDIIRSALVDLCEQSSMMSARSVMVHVGDSKGTDALALSVAMELGLKCHVYKAHWSSYGRSARPRRNHEMVDSAMSHGDCIMLAFPLSDSRGTIECMRYAAERGIEVVDCGVMNV